MNAMRWVFSKFSAFLFVLGALTVVPPTAQATSEGPYRMEVLINNRPVREYRHQGKTYIEAKRGREYSVRLTNTTGERVAVALSVDGLNSIDAKHTSAYAARKWILGPYESITIDGWQTSSATARQFYFTNERGSYGNWLGDTRNLGNISAAFFREERPAPRPYYEPEAEIMHDEVPGRRFERNAAPSAAAPSGAPSEAAPSAKAESAAGMGARSAPAEAKRSRAKDLSDDLAATGIGRERSNRVYTVAFKQQATPAAVMTVRYEFRDTLIDMGVIRRPTPDPMSRREGSSGFTDAGFAPDPYRRW